MVSGHGPAKHLRLGKINSARRHGRPSSRGASGDEDSSTTVGLGRGFTVVRGIGRGSFGTASLVRDREGKLRVMKIVDIGGLGLKQQEEAVNEVTVLASLKHPYIVRYRESFIEHGCLAIVMDYAEGGDLHGRIDAVRNCRQHFSEPVIMRWLTQAVLGLKYLHGQRILHRDLKTQNIFLSKQERLQIGDFGISRGLKTKAALFEERTVGTPYYLSPEIYTDSLYSFAGDVWALGCVLFELAALRVPFEASTLSGLVERITNHPAPQLPPPFSGELRKLCSDILTRDHTRRPTASDIVQRPMFQVEISKMLREEKENVPPPAMGQQQQLMIAKQQEEYEKHKKELQKLEQEQPQQPCQPLRRRCSAPVELAPVSASTPRRQRHRESIELETDVKKELPSARNPPRGSIPSQPVPPSLTPPASAAAVCTSAASGAPVASAGDLPRMPLERPRSALSLAGQRPPSARGPLQRFPSLGLGSGGRQPHEEQAQAQQHRQRQASPKRQPQVPLPITEQQLQHLRQQHQLQRPSTSPNGGGRRGGRASPVAPPLPVRLPSAANAVPSRLGSSPEGCIGHVVHATPRAETPPPTRCREPPVAVGPPTATFGNGPGSIGGESKRPSSARPMLRRQSASARPSSAAGPRPTSTPRTPTTTAGFGC
eukprot:TRINITY_DN6290_c2_g1_i1.p1 TRINITY_DN6290_c2_g1~~TRINITY_DN6290_c2_g1_i1.p1  ORF type:complete len:656 (+),score=109.32 TRINITY_DN6290_c2_g1_i1:276-2243(+)